MPRIPQLQQSQRMQPNAPVQIDDSRGARQTGNAIAAFGEGLTDLGQGISRFQQVQQAERLNQTNTRASIQAEITAQGVEQHAMKNTLPDGSDLTETFVTRWDQETESTLSQIQDENERKLAQQHFDAVKLDRVKKLGAQSKLMFAEYSKGEVSRAEAGFTQIVTNDPSKLKEALVRHGEFIANSSAVPGSEKQKAYQDAGKNMVYEAYTSLLHQKRFKDAKALLDDPETGAFLDVKEKAALRERRENTEIRSLQRANEMERLATAKEERMEKKFQSGVRDYLANRVLQARKDPTKLAEIEEEFLDLQDTLGLEPTVRNDIQRLIERGKKMDGPYARYNSQSLDATTQYLDKIATTPISKLTQLRYEINGSDIDPEDKLRLSQAIGEEIGERKNPPKTGTTKAKDMGAALRYIKDIYTPYYDRDGSAAQKADEKRQELLEEARRTGKPASQVAAEIVRRDYPQGVAGLLPEVDDGKLRGPMTKTTIKQWMAETLEQRNAGVITPDEANERAARAKQAMQLHEVLRSTEETSK